MSHNSDDLVEDAEGGAEALLGAHCEDEGDSEPWLVSYADLMTLLFGFFSMLFTFATFDDADHVRIRRDLAKYFGGAIAGQEQNALVRNPASELRLPGDFRSETNGKLVSFVTTARFEEGGAKVSVELRKSLEVLAELVRATGARYHIRIEGHTDDTPLRPGGLYSSNWELSAARAAAVLAVFEDWGFSPDILSAAGYGPSQPVAPNRDAQGKPIPENQKENRRIVIKVFPELDESAPASDKR